MLFKIFLASPGGPVSCIIAREGQILFESSNKMSSNSFDPTAHAEVVTIREYCQKNKVWNCQGLDLYVTSQPCPMCLGAIYWACFENVYFCNTIAQADALERIDLKLYNEFLKPQHARKIPCIHIENKDGEKLLDTRSKSDHQDIQQLIDAQWHQFV